MITRLSSTSSVSTRLVSIQMLCSLNLFKSNGYTPYIQALTFYDHYPRHMNHAHVLVAGRRVTPSSLDRWSTESMPTRRS